MSRDARNAANEVGEAGLSKVPPTLEGSLAGKFSVTRDH